MKIWSLGFKFETEEIVEFNFELSFLFWCEI